MKEGVSVLICTIFRDTQNQVHMFDRNIANSDKKLKNKLLNVLAAKSYYKHIVFATQVSLGIFRGYIPELSNYE